MSHEQLLNPGNGKLPYPVPDPEVSLKAKRRTFSAEYKLRILRFGKAETTKPTPAAPPANGVRCCAAKDCIRPT